VELVSDAQLPWDAPPCVRRMIVPAAYRTINASQGMARSLHYASLHSEAVDADWVVHLAAGTALRERTVRRLLRSLAPSSKRA
jgi:hypothetical protein